MSILVLCCTQPVNLHNGLAVQSLALLLGSKLDEGGTTCELLYCPYLELCLPCGLAVLTLLNEWMKTEKEDFTGMDM